MSNDFARADGRQGTGVNSRNAAAQEINGGLIAFRNALWVSVSAYALALTYFAAGLALLAWATLIPLVWVLRRSPCRVAAGYGGLWGTVYFTLFGLSVPDLLTAALPAFVVIGAVFSAFLALSLCMVPRRLRLDPVTLVVAWLLIDSIRIELVVRFVSFDSGQAIDAPTLATIGTAGLTGLCFLLAMVSILLLPLWAWARAESRERAARLSHPSSRPITLSALVLGLSLCTALPKKRGPPILLLAVNCVTT
jgi:apolipoprotein N-acyltransferase